jgi:predicted nucleic acid-binding protein
MLVTERATDAVTPLFRADPTMIVAWTTLVECASAIARAEHEGALTLDHATGAFARLDDLARVWREVEPTDAVRDIARRLLRVHRLRAADAIQLGSATVAAERQPATLTVVTLDERLEAAALKEGFPVIVPGRAAASDAHPSSGDLAPPG